MRFLAVLLAESAVMSTELQNDGTPAEVVIAKLEQKLQSALDARGLRDSNKFEIYRVQPGNPEVAIQIE